MSDTAPVAKHPSKILILVPNEGNIYGIHAGRARVLKKAFEDRGIPTRIAFADRPDFIRKTMRLSARDDFAVLSGPYFFDFRLQASQHFSGQCLFDMFDKPVYGVLGDHPFTEFMWERLLLAARTTHLFVIDETLIEEARFINPRLEKFSVLRPAAAPAMGDATDRQPFEERGIDVLVPMNLRLTPLDMKAVVARYSASPKLAELVETVFEQAMNGTDFSVFHIFQQQYAEAFGTPFRVSNPPVSADLLVLHALSLTEHLVRTERRQRLVRQVLDLPETVRIVVTQELAAMPELANRPNIRMVGKLAAPQLRRLYANSRIVLNSNPTFWKSIPSRALNAMASGAVLATDGTEALNEAFGDGELALYLDRGKTLGDLLGENSTDDLAAIAAAGRSKVTSEFTLDRQVDEMLETMGVRAAEEGSEDDL